MTTPEPILKYYECYLLHKKTPIFDGTYKTYKGEKVPNIVWICKECNERKI